MSVELKDIEDVALSIKKGFEEYKRKSEDRFNAFESELVNIHKHNRFGRSSNETTDRFSAKKALSSFVRKGDPAELLELDTKAMSTGSDPDGGFAVPEFIEQEIDNLEMQSSAIMQLARIVEARGSVYKKLINKRGSTSGWVGETDGRPETGTPQMAEVLIEIGELYANPKITQKLIDDAMFDAESFITEEIQEEFSDQLSNALINGDGINKPTGILQHPTSSDPDSSRAFGTLQFTESSSSGGFNLDDLKQLRSSLKSKYRVNAAWVMNETTAMQISTFKDSQGHYLWQESLKDSEHETLMGYPVYIDENMPDVASGELAIAFGNFQRGYYVAKRPGVSLLRDPYTSKPYVNFYATSRIGGGVVNSEAIKLLKIAV